MKVNLSILSSALSQLNGSKKAKNIAAVIAANERIAAQLENLPSGSGIDSGCRFLVDKSDTEKFVFEIPYHHMDQNGHYDGWTTYRLTVTPSFFFGFTMKIAGLDRNESIPL